MKYFSAARIIVLLICALMLCIGVMTHDLVYTLCIGGITAIALTKKEI